MFIINMIVEKSVIMMQLSKIDSGDVLMRIMDLLE